MRKLLVFLLGFSLLFPVQSLATKKEDVKAGFIREGNLWLLMNGQEKQLTDTGKVNSAPQWSPDGKWLLYQTLAPSQFKNSDEQQEIWIYHIETGEKKKIFYDGFSPSWAPNKNIIAFNDRGILDISNFESFFNIATGVSSFTWLPDGSGFLLSASGTLSPKGWSGATLYTKKINGNYDDIVLFGGVESFFSLPDEIGIDNNKIIAVYADQLTFSPSKKWISFIVSPTASWSMDSNMVCVISSDGKKFEVLDEIILDVGAPKWAPTKDTLAFIAGGGRIVLGFKNKDLKIREMPVSGSLTPENYADFDFDWVTDDLIITSRMVEKEWSNDFSEHPLPSLYSINLVSNKQTKITSPPNGYGDERPRYISSLRKLIWFRGSNKIGAKKSLWQANPDGSQAREWLKNVDEISFYE